MSRAHHGQLTTCQTCQSHAANMPRFMPRVKNNRSHAKASMCQLETCLQRKITQEIAHETCLKKTILPSHHVKIGNFGGILVFHKVPRFNLKIWYCEKYVSFCVPSICFVMELAAGLAEVTLSRRQTSDGAQTELLWAKSTSWPLSLSWRTASATESKLQGTRAVQPSLLAGYSGLLPLRRRTVSGFCLDVKSAHKTSRVREQEAHWASASRTACSSARFVRLDIRSACYDDHWCICQLQCVLVMITLSSYCAWVILLDMCTRGNGCLVLFLSFAGCISSLLPRSHSSPRSCYFLRLPHAACVSPCLGLRAGGHFRWSVCLVPRADTRLFALFLSVLDHTM